jgi:diguanylate cyclase (GGDEF)-like protein
VEIGSQVRMRTADTDFRPVPGAPHMAYDPQVSTTASSDDDSARLRRALDGARSGYWEDSTRALAAARRCQQAAREVDDPALWSRALTVEGTVALHRGDLRRSFALAAEAEPHAERTADDGARAELAALKAQLSFFSGSYAEALQQAELSIELADATGDLHLRVFARRAACVVFGNVGVRDWHGKLIELLGLTVAAGARWQEAISRNDLAHYLMVAGDLDSAAAEIERAFAIAHELAPNNRFALGILHCTRAEIRFSVGQFEHSVADSDRAIELLAYAEEPNPYVLGMTVVVKVRGLLGLGRLDEARSAGEGALERLGDRVPQARSMILTSLADALRDAGQTEDAYDALSRSAVLERQAFHELSELQLGLERATMEANAARREADAFAAKNRELEALVRELAEAHGELERRTEQLEGLQEQLRDQADRDWLTGLHNRRFLARELERLNGEQPLGPYSLAVLDLDHFKAVNDRYGHDTGDRVLVRVAGLLLEILRGSDIVVRTGGEEFVILMPFTHASAAVAACERVRRAISDEPWDRIAEGVHVTASVGVASAGQTSRLEQLAKLADRRLYDAKREGRDRVVADPDAAVRD